MTTKAPAKPAAKKTETKKAASKPADAKPAKKTAEPKPAKKAEAKADAKPKKGAGKPAAEGAPDLAAAFAEGESKAKKAGKAKAATAPAPEATAPKVEDLIDGARKLADEAPADQVPGQLAIPAEGNPASDVPTDDERMSAAVAADLKVEDRKRAKAPKADKPAKEAKPAVSRAERAAINRENGRRGGRKPKPEGEKYEGFRVLLPPPVLAWARQKAIDADMSQSEIVMQGWIAAFGAEVADLVPAETRAKLEAVAHVGA